MKIARAIRLLNDRETLVYTLAFIGLVVLGIVL